MKKESGLKQNGQTLILAFICILWVVIPLNAANYITVATIGDRLPEMDVSQGIPKLIEEIEKFWQQKLDQVLPDKPDLIVLPEHCDLPGGMDQKTMNEYLQVRENQIQDFFASVAKTNRCYIAFGTLRKIDGGSLRNSIVVVDRKGNVAGTYNKNFPTIGEMKSGRKAGNEAKLIHCDFGTIGCAICFDLNFEELRHIYEKEKPDIIVFSSMYHGGLEQNYWAYSCHSFFVGACGFREIPSQIRNPLGEVLASSTNYFDFAVTRINLDRSLVHLDGNWEKLSALKAKYGREVSILDPGKLGPVLVTSEDPVITVNQMINEFKIELLDDYFNRTRKYRMEPGNME